MPLGASRLSYLAKSASGAGSDFTGFIDNRISAGSLDISGNGGSSVAGGRISSDGLKCYYLASDVVYQYNLSVPGDVSSGSFNSSFTVTESAGNNDIYISPNGDKLFVSEFFPVEILEYNISNGNVNTASFVRRQDLTSLISGSGRARGFTFSADGLKLYWGDNANNSILEFNLSTAFDTSTITSSGNSLVTGFDTYGIYISDNGSYLITHDSNNELQKYFMSTPYDLSSAILDIDTSTTDWPQGCDMFDNGNNLYFFDNVAAKVLQYDVSNPI